MLWMPTEAVCDVTSIPLVLMMACTGRHVLSLNHREAERKRKEKEKVPVYNTIKQSIIPIVNHILCTHNRNGR
jgi:hypothetical protein